MRTRRLNQSVISLVFVFGLYMASMLTRRAINQQQNEDEIKTVSSEVNKTFDHFIKAIETETDWNVHITSGKRSRAEQEKLYHQNKKNAKPGTSKHELGLALDINLYSTFTLQHIRKADSKSAWEATGVPAIAKRFGLKWGGEFRTYHYPVHFEITKKAFGNSPENNNAHLPEDEHCKVCNPPLDQDFLKAHFQNSFGVTFLPYIKMAVR
jgi:hypothetical protein